MKKTDEDLLKDFYDKEDDGLSYWFGCYDDWTNIVLPAKTYK